MHQKEGLLLTVLKQLKEVVSDRVVVVNIAIVTAVVVTAVLVFMAGVTVLTSPKELKQYKKVLIN